MERLQQVVYEATLRVDHRLPQHGRHYSWHCPGDKYCRTHEPAATVRFAYHDGYSQPKADLYPNRNNRKERGVNEVSCEAGLTEQFPVVLKAREPVPGCR